MGEEGKMNANLTPNVHVEKLQNVKIFKNVYF